MQDPRATRAESHPIPSRISSMLSHSVIYGSEMLAGMSKYRRLLSLQPCKLE